MTTKPISEISIKERMQYIREQLAFDGSAAEAAEYLTRANIVEMFGECDLSDEDLSLLRAAAAYYLS